MAAKRDPKKVTVLAGQLRARIVSGEWKHGDALPSQAKLEKEYELSTETVRGALELLVSEALIHKRHGRASLVTYRDPAHRLRLVVPAQGVAEVSTVFTRDPKATDSQRGYDERSVEVPDRFATLLGLEPGATMVERTIKVEVDGETVLKSISYLPAELTVGSGVEWRHVEIGELALVGYPVSAGPNRVQARPPSPTERQVLGMHRGPSLAIVGKRYEVRVDDRTVPAGVIVLARGDRVFLERDKDQPH